MFQYYVASFGTRDQESTREHTRALVGGERQIAKIERILTVNRLTAVTVDTDYGQVIVYRTEG